MLPAVRSPSYYRCHALTLVPGSEVAQQHPLQVYLREDVVTPAINRWITTLFDCDHRESTLDALLLADDSTEIHERQMGELRAGMAAAEGTMRRLRRALEAGWDPAELREQYNDAVAEKRSAEAAVAALTPSPTLSRDEFRTHIEALGDMARVLDRAETVQLAELYASLRLTMVYDHAHKALDVEVDPLADRVAELCVRGGTRTLTTRLELNV